MNVILVVDVEGLVDQTAFEKHLKKEGLTPLKGELFVYEGNTTTHMFSTRAFLLEVVTRGLEKSGFDTCKMMFQVGENEMEAYLFNHENETFEPITL